MATRLLTSSYATQAEESNVEVQPVVKNAELVPIPSGVIDMNVSGTLGSPKEFRIMPRYNEIYHIHKVMFMTYADNFHWDTFSGSVMTNGVTFSYVYRMGEPLERVVWTLTFKDFTELSSFTEDIFIGNDCTSTGKVVWRCVFNLGYLDTSKERIELNPNAGTNTGLRFLVRDNLSAVPYFRVFSSGVSEIFNI